MLRVSFILNNGSGCSYHGVISTDAVRNEHKAEIQRRAGAYWMIIACNFLGKLLFTWLNGLCQRSLIVYSMIHWHSLCSLGPYSPPLTAAFLVHVFGWSDCLEAICSDWKNLFSKLLVMLKLLPNNTRCVYSIICFRNQRILYSPMFDSWPPTTQGRLGIGRTVTDCHMLDYMKWQPYKVRGLGLS